MANYPNFFIVGAAKSGTSALANFISQHPEVFMSPVKEPYFFVGNPEISSKEYLKLFNKASGFLVIGEASTGYLYDKDSPELIRSTCRDAKIIIILRNPIDMAFSLWRYMTNNGNENESFIDSICMQDERHSELFINKCAGRFENYLYLERAKYYQQVRRYYDCFGYDNVKVLIYERVFLNVEEACRDIFRFLDIQDSFIPMIKFVNKGGGVRYNWLKKMRNRKYPFLRYSLPISLRKKIREVVRDINVDRKKVGAELRIEERKMLCSLLKEDVEKLKVLLSDNLTEWVDFHHEI